MRVAQVLVSDVQSLLVASSSTRGELIEAAEKSLVNISNLSEEVKSGASCLGSDNQEAQVCNAYVVVNGSVIDHFVTGYAAKYSKGCVWILGWVTHPC